MEAEDSEKIAQPSYFLWKQNLKKNDKTQKAVIYLELINWTAIA